MLTQLFQLILLFVTSSFIASSIGQVNIPLPYPANGKFVQVVPKDVYPWKPQPMTGVLAPNDRLLAAKQLFRGQIQGAESVTFAPDGTLTLLDKYGWVWRATQSRDGSWQLGDKPFAHAGVGRPLGAAYDANGNLIYCDSLKGLMKLDKDTLQPVVLAHRVSDSSPIAPGSEIIYANDPDIAKDGTIYFTASVDIYPPRHADGYWDTARGWMLGMLRGAPKGRLLSYNPTTRQTHVLAEGFYYANGVALSADESFVAVSETDRIRINRFWLKGPKAGTTDVLIDHLPGCPDGISRSSDGGFWISLVAQVPPYARFLQPPGTRAVIAWVTHFVKLPIKFWGAVLKVSADGEPQLFLQDQKGTNVASVSSAHEHSGRLYLGNLHGNYVSYLELDEKLSSS